MNIQEYTLQKLKFGLQQAFSPEFISDVRILEHTDFMVDNLVIAIKGYVWAEDLETIKYPRDWWQAFKERWFAKWMLRRWPVIYKIHDIKATYPNLRPHIPDQERVLKILTHDAIDYKVHDHWAP